MNYKQIYIEAFGYDENSFISSEISGGKASDIHHIIGRGKKGECRIENLMALTRKEHEDYGDKKYYMAILLKLHRKRLEINNIPFDKNYFKSLILRYDHY